MSQLKGVVYMVNHQMEWAAILTENNSFSVVEVLGGLPNVGEIVSGDLESLGGETLYINSTKEEIDVCIQDIYATAEGAMRQLNIHKGNRNHWEVLSINEK